ncbi:MAG: phosphatase PAP2 family protein [Agathobacter sp.]|nr:phosphatase PAP2 family protein [Agathobacter sp.]
MEWEFDFLDAIYKMHTPILDKIMIFLSTMGEAGVFWILVAVVLLFFKKTRKCGLQMAIAMLLTFIVGNLILKNAIHRPRPCWINEEIELIVRSPKDYSFPSGHTMNGIVASLTIFFNNKKYGIAAIILALLIAFSRLYNYVHFPTDILGGLAIGIICAIIVEYIFRKKKWKAV